MTDKVEVTDAKGQQLPDKEVKELLARLQKGVLYLPQKR